MKTKMNLWKRTKAKFCKRHKTFQWAERNVPKHTPGLMVDEETYEAIVKLRAEIDDFINNATQEMLDEQEKELTVYLSKYAHKTP